LVKGEVPQRRLPLIYAQPFSPGKIRANAADLRTDIESLPYKQVRIWQTL